MTSTDSPNMDYPLHPCRNPLCERRVSNGVDYCCAPCTRAHAERYEIHESGPLGHSLWCNDRHAQRAKAPDPHQVSVRAYEGMYTQRNRFAVSLWRIRMMAETWDSDDPANFCNRIINEALNALGAFKSSAQGMAALEYRSQGEKQVILQPDLIKDPERRAELERLLEQARTQYRGALDALGDL